VNRPMGCFRKKLFVCFSLWCKFSYSPLSMDLYVEESMAGTLLAEVMLRDAARFAIDQRNQCLKRLLVTHSPFNQKLADGV
jgi:hypothetical protein